MHKIPISVNIYDVFTFSSQYFSSSLVSMHHLIKLIFLAFFNDKACMLGKKAIIAMQ